MLSILILNKPNITDFAEARNDLLQKSKTDWALFLDYDEKLSSPIENISDDFDGYELNRKNYFLGKYVGTDKIVRLGKSKFKTWKRSVHETWDIKKIGYLDNYIIHNTADNLSEYLKKINKYSDLHAKANLKEGKKSSLFKIIFFPIGKFLTAFMKSRHVVFSIMQSLHSYLAWTKLYFLQH
ncbi:MAG: glycosyl transferase family 2 [uncultured bacterium]|nr:MAG: glycosyl transferase family 2 [uncultured bacterium]